MSELTTVHRPELERSAFTVHEPEFHEVLGETPALVLVAETDAHEGPVYAAGDDALYFTTRPRSGNVPDPGPPRVAIKRVALDDDRFPVEPSRVSVIQPDTNTANGMALDSEGRLVVCEQGTRSQHAAVTRLDPATGDVETVVDSFGGRHLNSPNDVVVKSDGTIWFTDPAYGHLQGFRPTPETGDHVYRFDPRDERLSLVADSFDKPNGLAFSPDEAVLYVGDSGANQEPGSFHPERPHHVRAFDVVDGRELANERLFCTVSPGFPDGIKVDSEGRVYVSCFSGVQVFGPAGDLLGEVLLPGAVNFTFGGPDANVLFITADDAIWAARLQATGPTTPKGD